jgi:hypothetical protein
LGADRKKVDDLKGQLTCPEIFGPSIS